MTFKNGSNLQKLTDYGYETRLKNINFIKVAWIKFHKSCMDLPPIQSLKNFDGYNSSESTYLHN